MTRQIVLDKIGSKFSGLQFEDKSHTYYYKENKLKSVSSLLDNFVKKEDWDKIAGIVAKKKGVSKESILNEWDKTKDESLVRGKSAHSFAEILNSPPITPLDKTIYKFWEELDESRYKLIDTEIPMVHIENLYAGTTDFLLYDMFTNTIVVCDYKTNKDLFKNYNKKKMLVPFENLLDCSFSKYALQLSFYQILVEQIDIRVSDRWLIHVKEEEYITYRTQDHTQKLREWLSMKKFCIPS